VTTGTITQEHVEQDACRKAWWMGGTTLATAAHSHSHEGRHLPVCGSDVQDHGERTSPVQRAQIAHRDALSTHPGVSDQRQPLLSMPVPHDPGTQVPTPGSRVHFSHTVAQPPCQHLLDRGHSVGPPRRSTTITYYNPSADEPSDCCLRWTQARNHCCSPPVPRCSASDRRRHRFLLGKGVSIRPLLLFRLFVVVRHLSSSCSLSARFPDYPHRCLPVHRGERHITTGEGVKGWRGQSVLSCLFVKNTRLFITIFLKTFPEIDSPPTPSV
jgi:hypothetical protein